MVWLWHIEISGGDAKLLGVSSDTLRRWEEEGKVSSERMSGGHRGYDVAKLLGTENIDGKTIWIARVNTRPQKQDLDRLAVLAAYCESNEWEYEVISDIGSGINYNKRGLDKLVRLITSGEIKRLVITNVRPIATQRLGTDICSVGAV